MGYQDILFNKIKNAKLRVERTENSNGTRYIIDNWIYSNISHKDLETLNMDTYVKGLVERVEYCKVQSQFFMNERGKIT